MKNPIILVLLSALACWGTATPVDPTLPVPFTVAQPAVTGSTITVANGDDLGAKYNAASCGDKLVLEAGATFTGNFTFAKQCTSGTWIQLVSSSLASIPVPEHGTATEANSNTAASAPSAALYAKIRSTNGAPPIFTSTSGNVPAKYHYFAGLEVTSTVSQSGLVFVTNVLEETVASQLSDHVYFDRMYLHGIAGSGSVLIARGFYLTGSYVGVVNSYVCDIYSGSDSQAVLIAYGPGPYQIHNNYLSSSTEVIMAGGTGKTPGYSCTVDASPSPTSTSATVSSCIDAASGSVSPPAVGTWIMVVTSATSPAYLPTDWVQVATSAAGALTFSAAHAAPLAGAAHVKWGIVPEDIEVTRNYIYKPTTWLPTSPAWDGVTRSSKNFIESKYGRRWLIEGNVMVNSWNGGQNTAFNINSNDQNGDCPWCVSSDVTLKNNIVKGIAGAFGIIPAQSYAGPAPGPLARVKIENNLFWPVGVTPYIPGDGNIFLLAGFIGSGSNGGVDSLQIIHNTMLGPGINMKMSGGTPYNYPNLVIRDNLTEFDNYRWANTCTTGSDGTACIESTVNTGSTYTISHNAIINTGEGNGDQGVSDATLTSRYGSMVLACCTNTYAETAFVDIASIDADYHNYALAAGSPYKGLASDSTDPGVNFTLLDAALGGTVSMRSGGTMRVGGGVRV